MVDEDINKKIIYTPLCVLCQIAHSIKTILVHHTCIASIYHSDMHILGAK